MRKKPLKAPPRHSVIDRRDISLPHGQQLELLDHTDSRSSYPITFRWSRYGWITYRTASGYIYTAYRFFDENGYWKHFRDDRHRVEVAANGVVTVTNII